MLLWLLYMYLVYFLEKNWTFSHKRYAGGRQNIDLCPPVSCFVLFSLNIKGFGVKYFKVKDIFYVDSQIMSFELTFYTKLILNISICRGNQIKKIK
jgi:hypothetical protein